MFEGSSFIAAYPAPGLQQHGGHELGDRQRQQARPAWPQTTPRTVTDQLALDLAAKQSRPDVDRKITTALLDDPALLT